MVETFALSMRRGTPRSRTPQGFPYADLYKSQNRLFLFIHSWIKTLYESTIMALLTLILNNKALIAGCAVVLALFSYVVNQRFFHPLAKYPGPFLASLTDLWQVHQFMTLRQPYRLTELHEKHGPFVRYGPDKLSTTCESAVPLIFQKGGRHMPKTEFYDAYGADHPNVFGMRDEFVSVYDGDAEHAFAQRDGRMDSS